MSCRDFGIQLSLERKIKVDDVIVRWAPVLDLLSHPVGIHVPQLALPALIDEAIAGGKIGPDCAFPQALVRADQPREHSQVDEWSIQKRERCFFSYSDVVVLLFIGMVFVRASRKAVFAALETKYLAMRVSRRIVFLNAYPLHKTITLKSLLFPMPGHGDWTQYSVS